MLDPQRTGGQQQRAAFSLSVIFSRWRSQKPRGLEVVGLVFQRGCTYDERDPSPQPKEQGPISNSPATSHSPWRSFLSSSLVPDPESRWRRHHHHHHQQHVILQFLSFFFFFFFREKPIQAIPPLFVIHPTPPTLSQARRSRQASQMMGHISARWMMV